MFRGIFVALLFAVAPSSSNYTLQAYDVINGSGGGGSTNYQLQAAVGSPGSSLSSTNFRLPAGVVPARGAATPGAPTLTNPAGSYTTLHLVLNVTDLPGDYTYLIAISDDNFATTRYIQTDHTIGSSMGIANYQSYALWGGAGGFDILGLSSNTTYKVRVASLQGNHTGSELGPEATAATTAPSVTFALSTSQTSAPPFTVGLDAIAPGTVTSGNATVTADITTNAQGGGAILIKDANSGLTSSSKSYTLNSATANLAVATIGYGAQVQGVSQGSGGPMTAAAPFSGGGDSVGGLTTAFQQLATFASPVTSGSVTLGLKAKTNISVPAATDFTDTLTLSVSLLF